MLIFAYNGIPHICMIIIGGIYIFKRYGFTINMKYVDFHILNSIFKIGILGLGASISMFFISQSIPIIFSVTYKLNEVATYSVIMRLLNLVILFYTLMILPMWPAITDACVKKDIIWINKTLQKMRKYVYPSMVLLLLLFISCSKPVISWWTTSSIIPSMSLIIVCSLFAGLYVWNTQVSVFLNGASLFKGQSTYGLILAFLSFSIAYCLKTIISQEVIVIIISIGFLVRNLCMEGELKYKLLNSHILK